jgi:hypothetical protein
VLSAAPNNGKISWYENNGTQSFTEHSISIDNSGVSSAFASVVAVDVDGDNDIDVLSALSGYSPDGSYLNNNIAWYENNGSQSFAEHVVSTDAGGVSNVVAVDMDSDSDIDLLSARTDDDAIHWYENDGAQNFTEHVVSTSTRGAASVFAIDVDGDSDIDVLSAAHDNDEIAWHETVWTTPL